MSINLYNSLIKIYFTAEMDTKNMPQMKTMRMQQLYLAALYHLQLTHSPGHHEGVELQLGSKIKKVNLKILVMFIIGDIQGGDTLCGQSVNYSKSARKFFRMCIAGPKHLSKSQIWLYQQLIMQDNKSMVIEENWKELHILYQAHRWVAWFNLGYGGNLKSIFTPACLPEALHALENEIVLHMLKELYKVILRSKRIKGLLDAEAYK